MLHEEQFYLYDQIQTSQTGGQPYLHPLVSVVWLDCQFLLVSSRSNETATFLDGLRHFKMVFK